MSGVVSGVPVATSTVPTSTVTSVSVDISNKTCDPCAKKYRGWWTGCCSLFWFIMIIFLSTCWGYLAPTEYGMLKNTITGQVDKNQVYGGGRKYIGWGKEFLAFPAQLVTLSFGTLDYDTQPPIQARTGPAGDEDSSSGQPLSLSVSFQYKLLEQRVPELYATFGMNWEASYLRFAQQAITDVAQEFAPRSFWEERRAVERAMAVAVNSTLIREGMAQIEQLQLTSIFFEHEYEQMITNIQLQEQQVVTKGFGLQVTEVLQQVHLLQAEADATVARINADAARTAAVMTSNANAKALQQEQAAKATMYRQMRRHLNWTQAQFLEYIKMNALNTQDPAHVKLGVNPFGAVSL